MLPIRLLLTVVACAAAPQGPAELAAAPRADPAKTAPSWSTEVTARLRDGAHAFVVDGADYTASSPAHGLTGRFDFDGAWLETEDDGLLVRSVAVGRAGAMTPIGPTPPTVGACGDGREDPTGACIQRLEYAGDALTAWWAADEAGFEQGWTVERAPAGAGALTIIVAVEGARATVGDGEV